MNLIKDEFYHVKEYNSTTEYKRFPAETYINVKEIGESGKEHTLSAAEVTTTSSPKKVVKNKGENIVNKIFNSIKTAVTTTTVAAVAVVGAIIIPTAPKVELINFAVGGNYVEYEMLVEEMQDDLQYFIVVSTSNEEDREFLVEESGVYQNKVEGLKSEWEYSLSFISYDSSWGKTTYFEKSFQTTAKENSLPDYKAEINSVSVVGLNEIRIDFASQNLDENATLEILLYYDSESEAIAHSITKKELERGYFTTEVDGSINSVVAKPIIKYALTGEVIEFVSYTHTFNNLLDADIKVDRYSQKIIFYLKGISGGATHVKIVDSQTLTEVLAEELYGNYVEIFYQEEGIVNYTIFLTNEAGEKLTQDFNASVNIAFKEINDYTFNYKNPSEVGVTYNEDGTINVYIKTDFSTENEQLYYEISLGDMRFKSREPIFVAEGLENQSYALVYNICYDENGVQYCINSISVSGVVNEYGFDGLVNAEFTENSVTLSISDYLAKNINLNNFVVISSSAEEIQLFESDFVYNEDNWEYTAVCAFEREFEFITIYLEYGPFAENIQDISDYVGSTFIKGSTTIYK